MNRSFYRSYWKGYLRKGWITALWIVLLISIPRFIIVLNANISGNYQYVSWIFVSMFILIFIVLTRDGRKQIGMVWPRNYTWVLLGLIIGIFFCVCMYLFSNLLFGLGDNHWLCYIAKSYSLIPAEWTSGNRVMYFLIFSVIGMTFSPIGEELFYRGLIHENLTTDFGQIKASLLDSLAFSIVHLAHFGIVYIPARGFSFLFWPSLIWVLSLTVLCILFSIIRWKSGSILGAIIAHAGFNLCMNYLIFYYIF